MRFTLVVTRRPEENPVSTSALLKIFLFEPAGRFFRVSSPGPLPQTNEDSVVNARKDAFTHHVPMIIGPTSYFGVEPMDQIGGRHAQRSFNISADTIQKGLDVLFGRLNEQFPIGVRTFCPRKSKPFSTCVMTVFAGESSSPRSWGIASRGVTPQFLFPCLC